MGGPKASPEVIEEREKLAQKLKDFMKNNLFTEKKFADVVGISRRTVQMIKAASATPHQDTLERIEKLFEKYRKEGK